MIPDADELSASVVDIRSEGIKLEALESSADDEEFCRRTLALRGCVNFRDFGVALFFTLSSPVMCVLEETMSS